MVTKPTSRRSYVALFAPLVALALMGALSPTELVQHWENVTMDWRFRARADTDPPPDPRITLIGIGDRSLKAQGKWEDWTRSVHGDFAAELTSRLPKILAFDFFFPDSSADEEHDRAFADALAYYEAVGSAAITGMVIDAAAPEDESENDPLFLGKTEPLKNVVGDPSKILGGGEVNIPIPLIAESSWTGVVNCPPSEVDGMRRWIPMVARSNGEIYPSLVLQILMRLENATSGDIRIVLGDSVYVPKADGGEWTVPIDDRGFLKLNYRNTERLEMYDYIATRDLFKELPPGTDWPKQAPTLEDQIVLVGQSAIGLPDLGPTPYHRNDPLFRVQATGLDSILRNDYLHFASPFAVYAIWLILAWTTLFLLRKTHVALSIGIPITIIALFVFVAYAVFESHSFVLPIVLPALGFGMIHAAMIGERVITESRAKKHIHNAFGTYMAKELVDQIVASGRMPELGGEKVDITIMFSDIQGFSGFSEALPPEALVELMVEYLSALTDTLLDHGGTLDKYIGDAIDSMFGAPMPMEDHAYRAVSCAIAYQKKQDELRDNWRKDPSYPKQVHEMRTRIGINSGEAVVGNIGSRRRLNYAMMGDNVNLAARCESGAKSYGVFTMATEDTRNAAIATNDDIHFRFLDQIVVKGRSLPVKVYEVVDYKRNLSKETRNGLELYAKAMEAYLAMEWAKARSLFLEAAEKERFQPNRDPGVTTNPSLVMADRCVELEKEPPGENWDGVYMMTTK